MIFWSDKRPKGRETRDEFIKRRMREIEEENKRKMDGSIIPVRKKGVLESYLITEGYWPEEDTHHDVIRSELLRKSFLVGFYIGSFLLINYIYWRIVYLETSGPNLAYDAKFLLPMSIHIFIARYLFLYPLTCCMLYKLIKIHIPRMIELDWHVKVPEKEQTPLTKKINTHMDRYMFIATLTLLAYGKLLTIYQMTETLYDVVYIFNDDYTPLFFRWQKYLLHATGLWMQLDIAFETKYYACMKYAVNEELFIPQPLKDPYNPRTGIAQNPWLYMYVTVNTQTEDVVLYDCTPENPGAVDEVFKVLRTQGHEAARDKLLELEKDKIQAYNQGMRDIQKGVCHAYGERRPLRAGQFPYYPHMLYRPYPLQWLKEMAEGRR